MLDFGLCREFVKRDEGKLRTQRASAPFRGTTRYAPLNSMLEADTGRKDDIESWLYMVVEWTSGGLPWRKLKAGDRDKYTDSLDFYSTPDYKFVYYCIQHAAAANKIKDSDPLDWDQNSPYIGPIEPPGDGKVIELDVEGVMSNEGSLNKTRKERETKRRAKKEEDKESEKNHTKKMDVRKEDEKKKGKKDAASKKSNN
ncbi:hypothetical protein CAEBREN_04123 [Caenorhabditis brenneri]|uniref:Protein kinase domain-containing protein n=1 Tax=Caenorhabditis brenneri TaxID=135651 RepID=G0N5G9_CAEBE|nr:hypothetical protein CAEBREN_04123 [Caenorhabditis brenneri]